MFLTTTRMMTSNYPRLSQAEGLRTQKAEGIGRFVQTAKAVLVVSVIWGLGTFVLSVPVLLTAAISGTSGVLFVSIPHAALAAGVTLAWLSATFASREEEPGKAIVRRSERVEKAVKPKPARVRVAPAAKERKLAA